MTAKAARIAKYVQLPWLRGVNLDLDDGIMQLIGKGDYLVTGINCIFDVDGSKTKREGFSYFDSAAITGTPEIKGGFDYWANVSSVKTQKVVVWDGQATSKCWFEAAGGGAWTELTKAAAATAPTSVKSISFEVFNDDLVMAFTCANNTGPKKWNNQTGTEYAELGGSPPAVKFIRTHQGRLWGAGVPSNPDRLYFSSPGNHEEWNGAGDSGAIDIDPGDGDHSGITAIFPSFKGQLIVAKGSRLYRIEGVTPEEYRVVPISKGIGCVAHNAVVAVDLDDIYFMSHRGVHSLQVTEKYGDFEAMFLTTDIQSEFNAFDKTLLPYSQGVWIPALNSMAFAVSRNGTRLDVIWLYDMRFKAWYKWLITTNYPTALFRVMDSTAKRFKAYIGNNVGRLSYTENGSRSDYTSVAIPLTLKTPRIYPDRDPSTIKGFKKLGVWVEMETDVDLDVDVLIIGQSTAQELTFTSDSEGTALLDIDFTLGVNVLNATSNISMTPLQLPIDGYSTSVQLTFTQSTAGKNVKIYGFWIEWEPAGDSQETIGY